MNSKTSIAFVSFFVIGLFISLSFAPLQKTSESPIFFDNFDKYGSNLQISNSYQVWGEGADLKISLVKSGSSGSSNAMRVNVLEKNNQNGNKTGSFYHPLQIMDRDWSSGAGFQFWIKNLSALPLLISINFKEEFNEYWATTGSCTYYFISNDGLATQKECEYGNIIIPINYEGTVYIPFTSFNIPDWNTANGNGKMDLQRIESFAFGVTLSQDFPSTFDMDDLSVISRVGHSDLQINGPRSIQVPETGEHSEKFTASILEQGSTAQIADNVGWSIPESTNPVIRMAEDGVLTVPAGVGTQTLPLTANFVGKNGRISVVYEVKIISPISSETNPENLDRNLGGSVPNIKEDTYSRLSREFENWAKVNRPLFVILSVGVVLLALVVLSAFQNKLK